MDASIKTEFSTPTVDHLFELYKESKLNIDATYASNFKIATGLTERLSKEEQRIIEHNEIELDPEMFEVKDPITNPYLLFVGFNNFCKAIYNVISGNKNEFSDLQGAVRKKLPDLEALEFVGNNDLKISQRSANYSLLF